jgi:hypothetical protein
LAPAARTEGGDRRRWFRIFLSGLLSHVCTVAIVGIVAAIDVLLVTPRQEPGAFQAAARQAGVVIGPTIGTVTVFLFALWVARRSTPDPHLDGTLVGTLAAFIMVPLVLAATGTWRLVYMGSMMLKVMGGWAGPSARGGEHRPFPSMRHDTVD